MSTPRHRVTVDDNGLTYAGDPTSAVVWTDGTLVLERSVPVSVVSTQEIGWPHWPERSVRIEREWTARRALPEATTAAADALLAGLGLRAWHWWPMSSGGWSARVVRRPAQAAGE